MTCVSSQMEPEKKSCLMEQVVGDSESLVLLLYFRFTKENLCSKFVANFLLDADSKRASQTRYLGKINRTVYSIILYRMSTLCSELLGYVIRGM